MTNKKEESKEQIADDLKPEVLQDKSHVELPSKQQIEELTDTLKRVQAEFENYQKRVQKELQARIVNDKACFIRKLLPIIDSFELALKNAKEPKEFHRGMELIHAQLLDVLSKEGMKPIEAKGKRLDPYMHEVLCEEPSEHDCVVLEELQRGYMLNGAVLRHTKVKIGKKREPDGKHQPDKGQPA
ncbi:MAG: nucleotide exchange factor GrpE [Nanoarchaeota archaeon]